ncbi:phosphoribosylglycinamide formyltransferase [Marilutibacter alkalisoli]|uniref:Phosphoribosylglycinamide formyltransferase n=1 Tax=Marilutibacter alkalisoli TaxID=2591633 RepID=A0A514BPS7_9GAMM|nr:phosphoribosylglycinamide formyltransferase [Lysobacter alkalisoli]QDH69345.1 phosphoribosylglycinamide formyltransferase [Lysobacter alkalisoli]
MQANCGRRIAVLASGRGSNLQVLIDAIAAGRLNATIAGVFSDRPKAGALERARHASIPTTSLRPRDFDSRAAFDDALFSHVDTVQPDLIVCAGYMRLLSEHVVEARQGHMINIHPSLLPAFKGLHTHQQALAAGVREHGASVHFVTSELDGGPVIAQARVPVLDGDDADALAARVLTREHPLLLATVKVLAEGRVRLRDGTVTLDDRPLAAPLQLDDNDRLSG